jgi:hypothetical protein
MPSTAPVVAAIAAISDSHHTVRSHAAQWLRSAVG